MAGTTANVLVGGASKIEIAAWITAKAISLTYTDIGYTKGGVTIDPKVELHNIEVDQALGYLAAIPKKRELEIKMRMMEVNLENVRLALSMATGNLVTSAGVNGTLTLQASQTEQYFQMRITGKGVGSTGVRTAIFWRCVPKDLGNLLFKKDDEQGPEVTWQVCEDTTGTNTTATFGQIVDT